MNSADRLGGCLCGAVRYCISGPVEPVLHCHCGNCRRVSGNFVAASHVDEGDLTIEDATSLRWYDLTYARYAFCRDCGSTLFFKAADTATTTSVMTGTLDDATGLALAGVWFADDAQAHHQLAPDVPHYPGNDPG